MHVDRCDVPCERRVDAERGVGDVHTLSVVTCGVSDGWMLDVCN
jgi:hypothetical protein